MSSTPLPIFSTYLGGTLFQTKPNKEGLYICPCPKHKNSNPPKIYTWDELGHHFSNWHSIFARKRFETKEPIQEISKDLVDTPLLYRLGIVINRKAKLIICTHCRIALSKAYCVSHLREQHQLSIAGSEVTDLENIFHPFSILDSLPPPPTSPIPAIEGLDISQAYACRECHMASPKLDTLQKHYRTVHPDKKRPECWTPFTPVQQLNRTLSSSWFRVVEPMTTTTTTITTIPSEDIIAKLYERLEANTTTLDDEDIDARNITPWLRTTQWHKHTKHYKKADLCKMAEQPGYGEFPYLKVVVQEFWKKASDLINQTPQLILEKLNTPYPEKTGLTNTPFHHHQDHLLRMDAYISPTVGLLAMLLRRKRTYPLYVPQIVQLTINAFAKDLQDRQSTTQCQSLFSLLLCLWSRTWAPTPNDPITDPTIVYLMLSSIREDGGFKDAKLITNVIARFEYIIRLVFLQAMHNSDNIEVACNDLSIWFHEKHDSTFNSLRSLQHIASSISYSTISLPKIWWLDREHHQSLLYQGYPIQFSAFPQMFSTIEDRMQRIWQENILCGLSLSIQYGRLYDDLSNTTSGYSFISDPRNTCFQDRTRLIKAILNTPALYAKFITYNAGGVIRWNIKNLRHWLADYAQFQKYQLMLVATATGSPSRTTELTALTISNTDANPLRNLVVFDQYITVLVTYQKTSAITGTDKCIPHALNGFSADLLVQDLAIARPFAEVAAFLSYHHESPNIVQLYRTHIFVNQHKLFTTPDLTLGLEEVTLKHLGVKLGVNAWRHVSTAFRRKLCTRMDDLYEEDQMESVQALQSGHSRQTENRVYALSADSLLGAPEDLLPLFLDASQDWQLACKLVPGGLGRSYLDSKATSFTTLVEAGVIKPSYSHQQHDTLSTLSKNMASIESKLDMIMAQLPGLVDAATWKGQALISYSGKSFPKITEEAPITSSDTFTLEDKALNILRQLVKNSKANWTCTEQKQGVLAALELETDIIAALGTGLGKTMLAVIPALLETNKITVVILPLLSLMSDYQRKLQQMGIPFEIFTGERIHGDANLLLVSADTTKSNLWRHEATILNERKPIVRQVFDEAHIPIMSSDYRASLKDMFLLRFLPTQIILLSGTLPPIMQSALTNTFGLSEEMLTLRTSTNRPELQYIWRAPNTAEKIVAEAINLAKEYTWASADERGLVFVPFYSMGRNIADKLGCDFYSGDKQVTSEERQTMYKRWIYGKHRIMVCTSAFGAGNDYPHTRLVIHVGTPFEIINYIQEVSRAGRDKVPSTCILLPQFKNENIIFPDPSSDFGGKKAMYDALNQNPKKCVRFTVTSHCDPFGVSCMDNVVNKLCNFCQESKKRSGPSVLANAWTQSKKRRIDNESKDVEYVQLFQQRLDQYSSTCIMCLIANLAAGQHSLATCPTLRLYGGNQGYQEFLKFRKSIKYTRGEKVCYMCHVPQGPNDRLHGTFGQQKSNCQYPDLLAPLAYLIMLSGDHTCQGEAYFGVKWHSMEDYVKWINGPIHHGHYTNLSALFMWFAEFELSSRVTQH